jgi:hypothetical protein
VIDRDGPVAHNDACELHDAVPNRKNIQPLDRSDISAPVAGPSTNRSKATQDRSICGDPNAEAPEGDRWD